jgi:hypothetical protein
MTGVARRGFNLAIQFQETLPLGPACVIEMFTERSPAGTWQPLKIAQTLWIFYTTFHRYRSGSRRRVIVCEFFESVRCHVRGSLRAPNR